MKIHSPLLAATVIALASAAFAPVAGAVEQPPIPAGAGFKSWQDNGAGGRYVLQVIKGRLPKTGKPITGVVTSDTDCDADAQGLSHCRNTISLADGTELTVIDNHNMHRYRCLGPGDRLSLVSMGKSWAAGTLPGK